MKLISIATCLEKLGVLYGDTRDEQGRQRFLQFTLQDHYEGNLLIYTRTTFFPYQLVRFAIKNQL